MRRRVVSIAAALIVVGVMASGASASPPRVALQTNREGGSDALWTIRADGSGQKRVGSGHEQAFVGQVSPDGSHLAFTRYVSGQTDVYITKTSGGPAKRLTNTPTLYEWQPTFSPDGKRIAFTALNFGTDDGFLKVQSSDGGKAHKVIHGTAASEYLFGADWSPNGKTILLCRGGPGAVMTTRPDGSHFHVLVNLPGDSLEGVSWSPSGKRFVFASGSGGGPNLFTANADGSNVDNITLGGSGSWPVWVQKDRILYTDSDGDQEVYSIKPDGSNIQQLTTNTFNDVTGFFT